MRSTIRVAMQQRLERLGFWSGDPDGELGAPTGQAVPAFKKVQRRVDGVRRAPLGDLYRPAYFDGGVAIHGSASTPAYPASHGCARISNPAMDMLWASSLVEVGTPVRVV